MAGISGDWNWRRAVAESALESTTKHVLLTLSLFASEAGNGIFPSVATLARLSSLSDRAVRKHLNIATSEGWISKTERHAKGGRQTSNLYRLTTPGRVNEVQGDPARNDRGDPARNDPPTTLNGLRRNGLTDKHRVRDTHTDSSLFNELPPSGPIITAQNEYVLVVPDQCDHETVKRRWLAYIARQRSNELTVGHLDKWLRTGGWGDTSLDENAEAHWTDEL